MSSNDSILRLGTFEQGAQTWCTVEHSQSTRRDESFDAGIFGDLPSDAQFFFNGGELLFEFHIVGNSRERDIRER